MTAPTDNDAAAYAVVEGDTSLMMGIIIPRCYSDIRDKFSGCQVDKG